MKSTAVVLVGLLLSMTILVVGMAFAGAVGDDFSYPNAHPAPGYDYQIIYNGATGQVEAIAGCPVQCRPFLSPGQKSLDITNKPALVAQIWQDAKRGGSFLELYSVDLTTLEVKRIQPATQPATASLPAGLDPLVLALLGLSSAAGAGLLLGMRRHYR